MRKAVYGMMIGLVAASVTACAPMEYAVKKIQSDRYERYQNVVGEDRYMIENLISINPDGSAPMANSKIKADGYGVRKINSWAIAFGKHLFHTEDYQFVKDEEPYNSEDDALSKQYIKLANERGNTVKVYGRKLNAKVNRNYKQPFDRLPNSRTYYASDNLMVEYEGQRIKSILLRARQAISNLGVDMTMHASVIVRKNDLRSVENMINAREFKDNLIEVHAP